MNDLTIPQLANADAIRSRILTIRDVQVMLDRDLAALYGVEVSQLNRQVKRNQERFPEDFMFRLTHDECSRCQIGTLNGGRGSTVKYLPYAFTENGVAMLSGVLRSQKAIAANIMIMRAFVAMRRALASVAPILAKSKLLHSADVAAFNAQYGNSLTVKDSDKFHDRFLIIDQNVLIHVGASLNHLGKRCFAFASLDKSNIPDILAKI